MQCDIKSGSFSNSSCNEDAFGFSGNCAWVLDGSTGLGGRFLPSEPSDAKWYTAEFSQYLSEALPTSPLPLPRIFSDGVRQTWDSFCRKAGKMPPGPDLPCAVGAAVRWTGSSLEYIVVGDCRLLLRTRDGGISELYDRTHERLDHANLQFGLQAAKAHGLSLAQCHRYMLPGLRQARSSINRPGGYIALSSDPEAVLHAIHGSAAAESIRDMCLLSDGFAQYYTLFHLADGAERFLNEVASGEPRQLYDRLLAAQQGDPALDRFPRFKLSDDATLVYLRCI